MAELSVCIPVHHSAHWYLSNTLLSFANQTASKDLFEIVVATDGGDPDGVIESVVSQARSHGLDVVLVNSPRTEGHEELPHRNHTRNAACRASSGRLVWILDADFIMCPVAVDHILDVHGDDSAIHSSICFGESQMKPETFMTYMDAGKNSPLKVWELASCIRFTGFGYSGFTRDYSRSETATWMPAIDMNEGMPIVSRVVGDALGWFDEFFVGWGGNKEEFARRLLNLYSEGIIESRLITSVVGIHQPHPQDPRKPKQGCELHPLTVANRDYFRERIDGIRRMKPWWLAQTRAVKKALNAQT